MCSSDLFGEYFRDRFQNIADRITVGSGFGYHIIKTPKTEWDFTAGLAYQYLEYDSVAPGEKTDNSTPALVVGTEYELELNKAIDFDLNYNFQIVDEASGTYTHHLITTLSTELTSALDFDVSLIWDRIQDPTPNADGTVPDKDDYGLLIGIGFDF